MKIKSNSFMDVMKNASRMCKKYHQKFQFMGIPIDNVGTCEGCPAENNCFLSSNAKNISIEDIEDFENTVMNWVNKNPVHKYPTWNEWIKNTFVNGNVNICPDENGCNNGKYANCEDCLNQEIPEDIAMKLGIKKIVS